MYNYVVIINEGVVIISDGKSWYRFWGLVFVVFLVAGLEQEE